MEDKYLGEWNCKFQTVRPEARLLINFELASRLELHSQIYYDLGNAMREK